MMLTSERVRPYCLGQVTADMTRDLQQHLHFNLPTVTVSAGGDPYNVHRTMACIGTSFGAGCKLELWAENVLYTSLDGFAHEQMQIFLHPLKKILEK